MIGKVIGYPINSTQSNPVHGEWLPCLRSSGRRDIVLARLLILKNGEEAIQRIPCFTQHLV